MGTSSKYTGPKRSPLLPPDFNDGETPITVPLSPLLPPDFDDGDAQIPLPPIPPEENPEEENSPEEQNGSSKPQEKILPESIPSNPTSWSSAKKSMSRFASGNGERNKAVSTYIKAHGGSRNAARSAKSAIITTVNLGDFFGGVVKKGIKRVLEEYQIPIEGRKPKEILNDIVNMLAPVPSSNEEAIARKALITTMSDIYEKFDVEGVDITILEFPDQNITQRIITKYIETFIYERLIQELGTRIEEKAENSNAAVRIEKDLKEYIETKVSTTLKDKSLSIINSQTNGVIRLVEGLFQQCYKVLEDQL